MTVRSHARSYNHKLSWSYNQTQVQDSSYLGYAQVLGEKESYDARHLCGKKDHGGPSLKGEVGREVWNSEQAL